MKILVVVIVVGVILFFMHMRFACTGIYSKALVMRQEISSGQVTERVECRYHGWRNFHFELFKKWFNSNSLR